MICRMNWLYAAGSCCLLTLSTVGAAEPEASISKLLDVGWTITPQSRAAADEQWTEVRRLAGSDLRAIKASWLVLMQQRRFEEALKRIDEHLAKSPDDLSALRAKAWVQTVLKNYPVAFVTSDRLSSLLSTHRPTTDEGAAEHNELVGFLGRLIGFFGGPVADQINQEQRKSLEKKWLQRLDDSTQVVFEDARNGVLAKYIDMLDDSASSKEKALATAKADKEKSLAELQSENERLDARAKELEEKRKTLNNEFKTEMDEINRQDQSLVLQQTQLASRANLLNVDLLTYSSQITTLQQLAAKEQNQSRQQQYFAEINSLSLLVGRIDADLLGINRLLRNVQAQRAGLQTRRSQAQAATAAKVNSLDRELADLNKRERRNEGLERKASRPINVSTSKARSLSAQATALSTYDSFPLEAAKAQLLDSLR
jgi:DNA repair exonuclease SbcCD ATPase subunit